VLTHGTNLTAICHKVTVNKRLSPQDPTWIDRYSRLLLPSLLLIFPPLLDLGSDRIPHEGFRQLRNYGASIAGAIRVAHLQSVFGPIRRSRLCQGNALRDPLGWRHRSHRDQFPVAPVR